MTGPLGRVGGSLSRFQAGIGRVGTGIGQVGSGLMTLGTRAAVVAAAGLGGVITTAASFEQAFTGVEKTVDGTDAQLAELEGTVRQMARTMPVAFEELAAIGEAGGALGVARESLDEFIDVVARLAVSTDLSSDAAATALGQLGTILHLTESDYEDFADSLVALGNAGASTESQIVELAARFAAAGNSAGLTKEEILAISSAAASMGIEVGAGGTALSQTFNGITQAIGTGSDEVNAFTDTLGISAKEFKDRWTRDALGTFQAFLAELAKLDQYEQAKVLEDAGITGVRQLNAVKLMTQNLGFFGDQLDVARDASGALDRESQKFFDTTAGQWKVLKNNVRDAAATIGTELLPVTNELITDFVERLSDPGTQATLKEFGENLASGIRGLIGELKGTDFSGILDGMKLAAQVAKGAFDAFRSLPAPIQQLAIAALVANKVSGGAIGTIAKGLGNILLGSLRTITAANVTVIGGTVTGGGGPGVAGAAGGITGVITKLLGVTTAVGLGAILGNAIGKEVFFNPTVKPAVEFETSAFDKFVERATGDPERLQRGLDAINDGINKLGGDNFYTRAIFGEQLDTLLSQKAILEDLRDEAKATKAQAIRLETETRRWSGPFLADIETRKAAQQRLHDLLAPLPFGIGRLIEKEWSTTVNVNTTVNAQLSTSSALTQLTRYESIRYAGKTIPL